MSETISPSQHPALSLMEKLWGNGLRATDIVEYLNNEGLPPVKVSALAKYGQRNWNGKTKIHVEDKSIDDIRLIIDELKSNGLSVNKIGMVKRTGWGWEKQDGVNVQVQRDTIAQSFEIGLDNEVSYERANIPAFKINSKASRIKPKPIGWKLAVSLPDMQIGYHRSSRGDLTTTHDESAIDVAHQILLYLEEQHGIDLIVNQGDNADFPMFSTHRTAPGYLETAQLTIDRCGTEAAIQRSIAPNSKNIWLEGNHECRLTNTIVDKVPALVGLSRSGEDKPIISIPYLCKFDESEMEYLDGYPDAEYWANDGLRFVHGSLYSSTKGATANKYLSRNVSTIFGHTHRTELIFANQKTKEGGYGYFAGTAGCLCRTDGIVPSTSTGIKNNGKQNSKSKTEDWTQGIFIIWYEENGKESRVEPVIINNGNAIFRGIEFNATVDVNGNLI